MAGIHPGVAEHPTCTRSVLLPTGQLTDGGNSLCAPLAHAFSDHIRCVFFVKTLGCLGSRVSKQKRTVLSFRLSNKCFWMDLGRPFHQHMPALGPLLRLLSLPLIHPIPSLTFGAQTLSPVILFSESEYALSLAVLI